ncbi:hypothetical protein O181_009604 [Austropuccinia psidii MF-1]|uniref:Uncharacterized protein n=1 Tax=Austropuccinia psidii MF-1 TaxID=1389203 RepID=A0A9Q3BPK7_9BASI|nr:hypothetical protein [Austropuccinia psidii MF-1]
MPQDTDNKNLCKHTQDAQTFLVISTKGMAYINATATKITVCIDNAQQPLIIDSGAHCSIVARNYLDNYFPNWEKQLLPTKAKNFKSASGKMTSIGTIIKEIIIPHRKGNIKLNPEFVVLDDAHIQGFLLGTYCHRMYRIDIYNSQNRHITIGTNKENKFSLYIYQISAQDPLDKLLNEFREGQFSITLTSKQKLNLLKMLRKNRSAFAIGEEPLGKIRGHDIELYLDDISTNMQGIFHHRCLEKSKHYPFPCCYFTFPGCKLEPHLCPITLKFHLRQASNNLGLLLSNNLMKTLEQCIMCIVPNNASFNNCMAQNLEETSFSFNSAIKHIGSMDHINHLATFDGLNALSLDSTSPDNNIPPDNWNNNFILIANLVNSPDRMHLRYNTIIS